MPLEPFRIEIQRWRDIQDVRIGGPLQMRDAQLRTQKRPPHVDALHQIKPLHFGVDSPGQLNRTGIVDQHVDPSERCDRLLDCRLHLLLKPNIGDTRQPASTRRFNLGDSCMHRARQLRMRDVGLGHHRHIGPLPSRPQRDRLPNPPAGSGDQQCLPT